MTTPVELARQSSPSVVGSGDIAPPPVDQLLHGVTLRPPVLHWDGIAYTGARLDHMDAEAASSTPGVVRVVVQKDFVGVVASQHGQALMARSRLHATWATPVSSDMDACRLPSGEQSLPAGGRPAPRNPATLTRTYVWPAPSEQTLAWAIAQFSGAELTVWTCTRQPDALRRELSQICAVPEESVRIIANGQVAAEGYDVAADAAILARLCNRAVRVQQDAETFRADAIELKVSANQTDASVGSADSTSAGMGSQPQSHNDSEHAGITGLSISSMVSPRQRPSIAALLCGFETSQGPQSIVQVANYGKHACFAPPSPGLTVDSATLGLPPAAQVFAQESFFDEACRESGKDPVRARLAQIDSETGRELIASVAEKAKWASPGTAKRTPYEGRGFAYAHVIDATEEPPREVWSAWVADIRIDPSSGAIDLTGLTVGHNTRSAQTSEAPRVETDIRKAAAHWLRQATGHDTWSNPDTDLPLAQSSTKVQLVQPGPTGLAWSRNAELPAAAAIANAIYDATGVRFRQPPFDKEQIKRQLALKGESRRSRKAGYGLLGGIAAAVGGLLVAAMPWRGAIAPVANVDTSIYSAAAIERGRLVAAAGDCMVCHTAEGGIPNAGGLALETPFGKIYTTNITPDKETGIGTWSYAAFERAMREGIHRDGRHLYPAFPYTAFAKISDADMQSLYAYLMTREPVRNTVPATELAFPYNARPLLAGWNLLYHKNEQYQPDPAQTTLWNRGAYLVQGLGHCAACHSPRNALGAEKQGEHFLAGGFAEGWEAPALNALSRAPIPWTEEELYRYLRTGYSPLHGVASGPMAPVIQSMAELPDDDVRAVAHYLSTLAPLPAADTPPALKAAQLEARSREDQRVLSLAGENLFQGACAVCHDAREGPPLFGSRPSLALNTNLHSDHPDNTIQILLHGLDNPAMAELGYMPGFADSMNDEQLVTLLKYLRMRFAPDKPEWKGLEEKVRALRGE